MPRREFIQLREINRHLRDLSAALHGQQQQIERALDRLEKTLANAQQSLTQGSTDAGVPADLDTAMAPLIGASVPDSQPGLWSRILGRLRK